MTEKEALAIAIDAIDYVLEDLREDDDVEYKVRLREAFIIISTMINKFNIQLT